MSLSEESPPAPCSRCGAGGATKGPGREVVGVGSAGPGGGWEDEEVDGNTGGAEEREEEEVSVGGPVLEVVLGEAGALAAEGGGMC